jgi:heme exporter protein CcmD
MLEALTPWWPDFASFLQMGKHGPYVWGAFGFCALALALEWWSLRRRARALDTQSKED